MGIDNTTRRMQEDPSEGLLLIADALIAGDGGGSFITNQERAGQQQLVNSDRLPSDHGDDSPWLALGFTFGAPNTSDPIFCPATLPPGWKREGSDHAMWSYVIDEHGRRRAGVFYKAAFYDRSAHMHLVSLASYVMSHVEYDEPLVITDEWATRDAAVEAMRGQREENMQDAAKFREFAADPVRDERNRAGCAEIAERKEATAAKYEAAIAKLEAEAGRG